jgi:UDP-N-acetylenolpyruvoylglucosamine reductase
MYERKEGGMAVIENIVRELTGLFIDDARLAVVTLAILGTAGAVRYAGIVGSTGAAVLLCGGIFVAILENVLHSARMIERQNSGRN